MLGKLKDWAKANLTALIVGAVVGAVVVWFIRDVTGWIGRL